MYEVVISSAYSTFFDFPTFCTRALAACLYLSFLSYLKLTIFDGKLVRELWLKLDYCCQNLHLRDIEYEMVSKLLVLLVTLSYFFNILNTYLMFIMYKDRFEDFLILRNFFLLTSNAVVTEMCVIVFCIYRLTKYMNEIYLSFEIILLEKLLKIHCDLLMMCRKMNIIFSSLFISVLTCFVALTLTIYNFIGVFYEWYGNEWEEISS